MNFSTNPFNTLQLQGNIVKVREYSRNKAANITIAIKNGEGNEHVQFIQLKSFKPACYNTLRIGLKVRIYGHIFPNSYEKNGETIHSTDLVADYIDFLETKAMVEAREARKNERS